MYLIVLTLIGLCSIGWTSAALAQSDEIQVYDGALADPGIFNLTWHNNYTFSGSTAAEAPGGIPANHSLNGVTEWAYGVNKWLEVGLYLPLYTIGSGHAVINGYKPRALFAVPDAAQRTFFYGIGFELSQNAKHWDSHQTTTEFRPIIGWHLGKWDLIFNPILDTAYDGVDNLVFAPSTRVAYNISTTHTFAVEEYADFGKVSHFASSSEQSHQLYGVYNYAGNKFEVEAGLGFGLTSASDNLVAKLILAWDLN